MVGFNLSVDFELSWGDLERTARDAVFHQRVNEGLERTLDVVNILEKAHIPSTWAVVGGCCCSSLEELRERSPQSFAYVRPVLEQLRQRRADHRRVLFCRPAVDALAQRNLIEVGSHGFLHLTPPGLAMGVLQEDAAASVLVLQDACGRRISSFVPPQNYFWPKEAFSQTSIQYVRHSPNVYGQPYCGRGLTAKLLRMGNDVLLPTPQVVPPGKRAALVFLRIDRGSAIWRIQLGTLESAFRRGTGTVYCFTHPHNFYSAEAVRRLAELCDVVRKYRDRGTLEFRPFARNLELESCANIH